MNKSIAFSIVAGCLMLSLAAFGQVNVKDSVQTVLQNDTADAHNRFNSAYVVIYLNSSPEEAEQLGMNVLYPFVQKNWKEKSEQLSFLSNIYLLIAARYYERGGEDKYSQSRIFWEKALETAQKAGNDEVCAISLGLLGTSNISQGNTVRGQQYIYEAITYYDKQGMYVQSAGLLYNIAGCFSDIKDTEGMARVLAQMEDYFKKDNSKQSQHQYNVMKHRYFELLVEKEKKKTGKTDFRLADSTMLYMKRNIALVENHLDELSPNYLHGWDYYYIARALDSYYPEQNDSIVAYVNKAMEMLNQEQQIIKNDDAVKELLLITGIPLAKAYARKGNWQEAYKIMTEKTLPLLDELKGRRNITDQRHAAYQFMADYHEKFGNIAEALAFEKLLRESEAERYENEKVQAINDMSAKYETEKKEVQIQTLSKQKKLLLVLAIALFFIVVLVVLFSRLKRKNIKQQLYETALLAELHQNELEKIKAGNRQADKQELERYRAENTIESITQMVSDSLIESDSKKIYSDRLSKLDAKLFENIVQNGNAKITSMDMKYLICFAADIDVKDISTIFNIEPASVHTVRYRIRKKYAKESLPFL